MGTMVSISIQAYLAKNVTAGATPFVTRSLNSAGMDPGGSVGVGGHLRPVGVVCSAGRRFDLWAFTSGRFGTSP